MNRVQTWENVEEMRRAIRLMLQGNPYFAWQHIKEQKGEQEQVYNPCRDLRQLERYEDDIFKGTKTPGFYSIRADNLTRWGAIDFDEHGCVANWKAEAERAYESLKGRVAEIWLEESSPRRYHVIILLDELVPAATIRVMLREFAPDGVEVFPKADTLRSDPTAKGSLLRFPGKHQLKGTYSHIIARSGRVSDTAAIPAAPRPPNWVEPSTEGRLRSLYSVATRGIVITGCRQRYRAMQRIAGRLKGRATNESEALWVYTAWHRHFETLIRTSLEQSREEFLACFRKYAPCDAQIPDYPLAPAAESAIARLPKKPNVQLEDLQQTARLLLRAKLHADSKQLSTFFLSCITIAGRLGCSVSTAGRLRTACQELGIVKLNERGHTGWASDYWLGRDWDAICQVMQTTPEPPKAANARPAAESEGAVRR